ncbi:MAG: nitrogenase component 1 [Candidatus Bathyarchaeia archaeon]|jgi:nitrogenase iron protein
MVKIALYGKGGIGKSTTISNVTAALAEKGHSVLQIGCDPKHDSTRLLLGGFQQATVLEQLNHSDAVSLNDVMFTGYKGIKCIESGGPEPGVGCAGRGIIQMTNLLKNQGLDMDDFDFVFFDVLGDVVCGGFAVPMREGFAEAIYIVTSGELASLYAANNIAKGLKSHSTVKGKLAGIIGNERGTKRERDLIAAFAKKIGTEMTAFIPRSEIVQQAELESQTVIQYAPNSELAQVYRSIADTIEKNRQTVIPTPLGDLELENFVSEFCYGKKSSRPTSLSDLKKKELPSGNFQTPTCSCDNTQASTLGVNSASSRHLAIKPRTPMYGCSLAGAYNVVHQINDALTVMDSPQSCGFITFATTISTPSNENLKNSVFPNLICTNMREKDVIFGAEKNLKEVITRANRKLSPTATFVITSCPSGIIGEDVNPTIAQARKEGIDIVGINTDGILTGDFNTGMLTAYKTVAEHFIDKSIRPTGRAINIIGEQPLSTVSDKNFKELKKILDFLGLKINCRFIKNTNIKQIKEFKKASVNIPAANEIMINTLMFYFENQFNVPALKAPLPLAFNQTVVFTRALGKTFGCESAANELVRQARADYESQVAELKKFWSGKKVLIFSAISDTDWMISTLLDLNVNIQKVCYFECFYLYEPSESKFAGKVKIETKYNFENRKKDIAELKPDLVLMNFMPKQDLTSNVPHAVFPLNPNYGFNSGLEFARKWAKNLKVPLMEGWKNDAKLF